MYFIMRFFLIKKSAATGALVSLFSQTSDVLQGNKKRGLGWQEGRKKDRVCVWCFYVSLAEGSYIHTYKVLSLPVDRVSYLVG